MAKKQGPVTKSSRALLTMLNRAIAREMQVAVQYMWQHVQWAGVKGFAVHDALKSIAIAEMKHAESIAERLFYLGEIPTTKPDPIFVGTTLKEMITNDVAAEVTAIKMYKDIIKMAFKEGDETTAQLFREILEQEEEHHDTFTTLLEDL
ncbi:MAG: ferritin-like domain-containing protein [Dehalococcoidia bacterium]|jgi:bacterioferritin